MENFSQTKIFLCHCLNCNQKYYFFETICPKCSSAIHQPLEIIKCNLSKDPLPRSFLIKCTFGNFLEYTTEKLLHIGVSISNGNIVVNFDENGMHTDKTGWEYAINIEIKEPNEKFQLTNSEWNLLLQDYANRFMQGPKYHTINHNCYTFVIGFLNEMKFENNSKHTKETIVETFLAKPIDEFEKFFFLFKEIEKNGFAE